MRYLREELPGGFISMANQIIRDSWGPVPCQLLLRVAVPEDPQLRAVLRAAEGAEAEDRRDQASAAAAAVEVVVAACLNVSWNSDQSRVRSLILEW